MSYLLAPLNINSTKYSLLFHVVVIFGRQYQLYLVRANHLSRERYRTVSRYPAETLTGEREIETFRRAQSSKGLVTFYISPYIFYKGFLYSIFQWHFSNLHTPLQHLYILVPMHPFFHFILSLFHHRFLYPRKIFYFLLYTFNLFISLMCNHSSS